MRKVLSLVLTGFFLVSITNAQNAEIKISLNEQFFDALLEAVFKNLKEPKVNLAGSKDIDQTKNGNAIFTNVKLTKSTFSDFSTPPICDESVRLEREINGVKTAVRFREGKIYAPIAFTGNYNPPLIGCVEFQGWAETNIELAFDKNKQALVGNAKVLNVNLSGTGGLGGGFLAKLVQGSIDRKVNPIEVIRMDKISFTVPIQNSGSLRMKAVGMRHVVNNKSLDVYISYQFQGVK